MVLLPIFHAMAFSTIFQKQFFVFERQGYASMTTRIISFMKLLHACERVCNSEERVTVEYVEALNDLDYLICPKQITDRRRSSLEFLQKSLSEIK